MKYLLSIIVLINFYCFNSSLCYKIDIKPKNSISAYYNTNGAFAGFIQKKNNLIRACEFSTNGTILSCSKWFDEKFLNKEKTKDYQ